METQMQNSVLFKVTHYAQETCFYVKGSNGIVVLIINYKTGTMIIICYLMYNLDL